MDKRKLRYRLKQLRLVPTWAVLVLTVVFGLITVASLRANNQNMIDLRQAVYDADEQGTDVEEALKELREYVYSHMNTNLSAGNNTIYPPIQLKYTYERLLTEKQVALGGNEGLYTQAQNYCEKRHPGAFYGRDKLPCIRDYLSSHGAEVDTEDAPPIPSDQYKFDFASPRWSPDLAGWSLVITAVLGLILIFRLASELLIKYELGK